MSWFYAVSVLMVIGTTSALAAEPEQPCENLMTPKSVLQCALRQHPDLQRAQVKLEQARELPEAASQLPNPELESKFTFGSSLGDDAFRAEVNVGQPLELGGKRGDRTRRAEAEQETVAADALKDREQVVLQTLQGLTRLRQLKAETGTLAEALDTFERILKQFRSKPRLNPEQEVSVGIFRLADSDYRLRKASTDLEIEAIRRSFELSLGRALPHTDSVLPQPKTRWPELVDPAPAAEPLLKLGSSAAKTASAGLKLAQAELSVQQGLSWPDLRVGPSFERETEGPFSVYTYGFNVSFPIPILSLNGGGRAVAHAGVARAERNLALVGAELSSERRFLSEQYRSAIGTLGKTISLTEIERSHHKTENLFARGLIPSSLVIEAHRQMVDFQKNHHEQELKALEALWKISILDGRLEEIEP